MIRRVFVSDIHMSLGGSLVKDSADPAKTHEYDWFDLDEAAQFLLFLQYLLKEDIQEVILLGDIMDDWLYPHDISAPTYKDTAAAGHIKPILEAIDGLSKKQNVTITYIPGNHDMGVMDKKDPAAIHFRKSVLPKVKFIPGPYQTNDGIYAEHGHSYLVWNANDPNYPLPVGYYLTRLIASISAYTNGKTFTIPQLVRGLANKNALIDDPLTFLAKQLDGAGSHAVGRNTWIAKSGSGIPLQLKDVRKVYGDLPARWSQSHKDILAPWESVWYEVVGLLDVARDLVRKPERQVVIFGHTHDDDIWKIGPAAQIPEHEEYWGIYANCGSWCYYNNTSPKPYSWVVTESGRARTRSD